MFEVEVGVEIRQFATIRLNVETLQDIPKLVEKAVAEDSPDLDKNTPEIDYVQVLNEFSINDDDVSPMYDRAFEEQRDAQFG